MKKISALLFGIIFSMLSLMVAYATNLYIPMITSHTATSSTSRAATVSLAWTTTGSRTPPEFFMIYKTGTGNSYSGTLFVGSGSSYANRTGAYTEYTTCSTLQDLLYVYQVEVLDSDGGSGISDGVLVTVKKCPTLVPRTWNPRVPPRSNPVR